MGQGRKRKNGTGNGKNVTPTENDTTKCQKQTGQTGDVQTTGKTSLIKIYLPKYLATRYFVKQIKQPLY